jgi:sec-independent protein translocase protein TatC
MTSPHKEETFAKGETVKWMLGHTKKTTSFLVELRYRVFYYFIGFCCAFTYAYYQKDILLYRLFRSLHSLNSSPVEKLAFTKVRNKSYTFDGKESSFSKDYTNTEKTENLTYGTEVWGESSSFDIGDAMKANEVIFLEITEAFYTELYMLFVISFFISLPLFWIQAWFFLAPGLYSKEQFFLGLLSLCSWLLILFFAYFTEKFLLPKAWAFFLSFGDLSSLKNGVPLEGNTSQSGDSSLWQLRFMPSIALYWKLYFQILLAMILSSQFPIILFLLIHWKWLSIDFLIKGRPWWIVFFLSWGALLSPPDLFSQFLIFFPLFFFYEFIVFFTFCQKRWASLVGAFKSL